MKQTANWHPERGVEMVTAIDQATIASSDTSDSIVLWHG